MPHVILEMIQRFVESYDIHIDDKQWTKEEFETMQAGEQEEERTELLSNHIIIDCQKLLEEGELVSHFISFSLLVE